MSRSRQPSRSRQLSFEELEPRTLLTADFVGPNLLRFDERQTAHIHSETSHSTGESWSGLAELGVQMTAKGPEGSPDGSFYVNDSLYLQIDLADSKELPLSSGRSIRLIVGFDPLVVDPEGIVSFPGEIPDEYQLSETSSELTIKLPPVTAETMTLGLPFRIIGAGKTALSVTLVHSDPTGQLDTSEVMLTASTEISAENEPVSTGPIAVDRPPTERSTFDTPAIGRDSLSATSGGLLGIRPLAPRSSLAKSTGDFLPLSLGSEKQSPTSAGELTIKILRRPQPTRSSTTWGLFEDATANLFQPLELHDFENSSDANALIDRRTVRLHGSTHPMHDQTVVGDGMGTANSPRLARQPYSPVISHMPSQWSWMGGPVSLRMATVDDYDAIFAAWQAPSTTHEEQPPRVRGTGRLDSAASD